MTADTSGERAVMTVRTDVSLDVSEGTPARELGGVAGWITSALALGLAAFALYWTQFSIATPLYRASFLMIALVLTFLLHPAAKRRDRFELAALLALGVGLAGLYAYAAPEPLRVRALRELVYGGWLTGGAIGGVVLGGYSLWQRRRVNATGTRLPAYDLALCALAIASLCYLILHYDAARQRVVLPIPTEIGMGILLVVVVLEATRRTTGAILPAVTIGFLAYAYLGPYVPEPFAHRGYSVQRIVAQNYLTLEGIFGVPLDVCATFIALFTTYGAILERSGAGRFFLDWSFAALGRSGGGAGAARTVTLAGFLLGTVSGSGVATTVTLGSLSWPLLQRAGFAREPAGGVLAAAGIGALLSPPTLGAAAFLLAEYLDITYLDVLIMATLPALLYYLSCLLMIEADSRRMGVRGVSIATLPLRELTRRHGYHFLSLFAVVVLMAVGMTAFMAVFWSIVIAFVLSYVRADTRLTDLPSLWIGLALGACLLAAGLVPSRAAFGAMLGTAAVSGVLAASGAWRRRVQTSAARPDVEPRRATELLAALVAGGKGVTSIAATTATAGLIVSVVTLTGLGLKLSGILVSLSGGVPLLTIVYAALGVWVLGLAVPVTASYIIAAVMIVPALTQVGVLAPAAHMFVFYYAVLADVSPPTALAPFAAAAVTGGNPFRTMLWTWRYTLPAFVVPFVFTGSDLGASLLLVGPQGVLDASVPDLAWTLVGAILAVAACAGACAGWIVRAASTFERGLLGCSALALLWPSAAVQLAGLCACALALVAHMLRLKRGAGGRT